MDKPSSTHNSSKLTISSRSGTNRIALLQQWSPPDRIIRTYPMAFPYTVTNQGQSKQSTCLRDVGTICWSAITGKEQQSINKI